MINEYDPVRLLLGGKSHEAWQSYRIDSDLLMPADDWHMTVSASVADENNTIPDFIYEGADARVMLGDNLILTGRIDTVDDTIDKRTHAFQLYGRDMASVLLDCSAPLLSMQLATLEQIITKAVQPLGIKKIFYQAKPSAPRKKVHTEPGQTVWDWLQSACEANQVWPWLSPDGTLIIGAPDYTAPPVATFICRRNGDGNNIKSIQRIRGIQQSYSEITVLGQSSGDGDVGHHNIKGVIKDDTMPFYRPRTVVDGNCESNALALQRANKLMSDSRMGRDRLIIDVEGHRVVTSSGKGLPWAPGMRARVISEPQRVDGTYYVMKRTFIRSRSAGTHTELHLVPDGTWLLNVPFVKAKRRANAGTKKGHYAGSK